MLLPRKLKVFTCTAIKTFNSNEVTPFLIVCEYKNDNPKIPLWQAAYSCPCHPSEEAGLKAKEAAGKDRTST